MLERHDELAAVELLLDRGGVLVVEGGAGIGKTAVLEAACRQAEDAGWEVLGARGSELEAGFAFGVVRQLFERRLAGVDAGERAELVGGAAAAAGPLFSGPLGEAAGGDTSFAVLHGLYWLAANLAAGRPLLIAVDDAHWADGPSLRWLAYLAARVEGLDLGLLIALRPTERASGEAPLLAVRGSAALVRPRLLSQAAVTAIVRQRLGEEAGEELCAAVKHASGGNPFYVREAIRALELDRGSPVALASRELPVAEGGRVAREVSLRVGRLGPEGLGLAQALAVLGDGCELRHAAEVAGLEMEGAVRLASGLVRLEVLASDAPPCFLHPIVRAAVDASLESNERDVAHRAAARLLHAEGALPGRVAAHLVPVRPAGDRWVVARLQQAAREAMASGAPDVTAELLARALAEPPSPSQRVEVLRQLALAEEHAGHERAFARLQEALELADDPAQRGEIALQLAQAHASLFRAVEAVEVLERAIGELDESNSSLVVRLEGELVATGLQDARTMLRALPVFTRLAGRQFKGAAVEAVGVAQGMAAHFRGRPAAESVVPFERALAQCMPRAQNWNTRAAVLFGLLTCERFEVVEKALPAMLAQARSAGSARGLIASYSALGFLKLREGDLPEADSALRIAWQVLREGDFGPGLAVVAILADVAVETGDLDEADALLTLDGEGQWPANMVTILVPAARGRLRLAQGRAAEALGEFERCLEMLNSFGMGPLDSAYVQARSGAAMALLRLGEVDRAREVADVARAEAQAFGAPRFLGLSLRVAGLARGRKDGLELLRESVAVLRESPAVLERAHSLAALGGALRRAGRRADAREPLEEALDLAARCAARPLTARVREELKATGARPRREWRAGVEALTPSELRVASLAAEGHTNREIARELYVTPKTVEGHLARAYAKLGIAGRPELPDALGGEKTRVPTP